ncbi:MAG: SurA N-terminal domain-containing protein [Myxococcota bacterium]
MSSAVILCLSLSGASMARAEVIERVVAVVNDEALFLSELRRRASPLLDRVMSAPTEAERVAGLGQLYSELLEVMINEALIDQAARRMSIRVTTAEVEQAIRGVIRENGLEEREFWRLVAEQGFTEAQYRRDVRSQLLRLKVLNQRVRSRVNITEAQVREAYDQRVRQANRRVRSRASHVFLTLPAGASAADVAQLRAEARAIKARLDAGETFARVVADTGGGELGWLSEGDLPSELEEALTELSPGQYSDPVRGAAGFHIFLLHEREQGGSELPAFDDVREQLQNQMMQQAMARQQEEFMEELRRDAIVARRL